MSPATKHSFADHCSMTYKDSETIEIYTDFSFSISSTPRTGLYSDSTLETDPKHQTELRLKLRQGVLELPETLALGLWADTQHSKSFILCQSYRPSTMCDYYQNFYIYSTCTNAALHFFRTSMDGNAATKCPKSPHGRYIVVAGTCPHCR